MPEPPPKLFFDENLSARLVEALSDIYPGSVHVRAVTLAPARDRAIWAHAKEHGFVIVSKDEDFHRLSLVYGAPPKVIWIRTGNCSTNDVANLLRARQSVARGIYLRLPADARLWRRRREFVDMDGPKLMAALVVAGR